MATLFPYTNISATTLLGQLVSLLNSSFQAGNQALTERVAGHRVSVLGYAATGATTTKLSLYSQSPAGSTPWAVLLVRCRETRNPGGDLAVTTRLNFTADTGTLYVYEPAGLTQYTQYDMDFLVLE